MQAADSEGSAVFEVQYIGEEDVDQLCKKLAAALDEPSDDKRRLEGAFVDGRPYGHVQGVSPEYLGYFFGPKYDDPHTFVIVLKWKSRPLVSRISTSRYVELAKYQAFGRGSKVLKQAKMVAD